MALSIDDRHIIDLLVAPKASVNYARYSPKPFKNYLRRVKVDIIYTRGLIIWPSTNVKKPLWFLKLQGYS